MSPRKRISFGNAPPSVTGAMKRHSKRSVPVSPNTRSLRLSRNTRAPGAEQHFTLVGCGKFALGDKNGLPLPYSPSMRHVEDGDSVVMEISPCLEGYWTQLVRTVNVGSPNAELEKLYRVSRDAIKKALEVFKSGKKSGT